eukprot:5741494-Ditylum_brightwellii.AAC.1
MEGSQGVIASARICERKTVTLPNTAALTVSDVKVIHPAFLQTLSLVSSSSSDLPTVTLSTYTPYNGTYVLQSYPTKSINDALIA